MSGLKRDPHRVALQQLRPLLCRPQTCVSAYPCQHFEVDASLPDAVMETERWGSRGGLEEVSGGGGIPSLTPLAHLSQLITAVMAQRNESGREARL